MGVDSPLITLIKARIAAAKRSQRKIADQAGIHPSQLTQLLRGTKGISRDKLLALARVLGVGEDEILAAAGLETGIASAVRADLSSPYSRSARIKVISDPRFIDSAVFMWMCSTQPFLRHHDVVFELVPKDWSRVPPEMIGQLDLSEPAPAIGFYNRNPATDTSTLLEVDTSTRLKHWTDFCLYRGYAVLARRSDTPEKIRAARDAGNRVPEADIRSFLKELVQNAGAKKATIITIGADTDRVLSTPLFKTEFSSFNVKSEPNPDYALSAFRGNYGSLFVGGLPQRLRAEKNDSCIPIVTWKEDPFLFSINSLFCTPQLYGSSLVYWIEALWHETISKMADKPFRDRVATECQSLLRSLQIDPEETSLSREMFEDVLGPRGREYEVFLKRGGELNPNFVDITAGIVEIVDRPREAGQPRVSASEAITFMRTAFGASQAQTSVHAAQSPC
jgi:transcriptional regulator with XRE-family HTH domain